MGPSMGPPQAMPMLSGSAADATGASNAASLAVLQADVQAHLKMPDSQTADPIVAALLVGNDAAAAALFAASNRTSTADGASIVASLAADAQAAQLDMKRRADRVAHDAAVTLWTGFASVLLGLIAAILGGWVGAHHIGRVYHLRAFETSANHRVK